VTADHRGEALSFVLLAPRLGSLRALLAAAFTHPWVASYQVGFGPPLIRSSERLAARLERARSALDKLEAYLEVCVLDEAERQRLAAAHRRLLVRLRGPLEAEEVDAASAGVFDLSLRLHHPGQAREDVRAAMLAAGVDDARLARGLSPDDLSGRFQLRLLDPTGDRLLHADAVRAETARTGDALALELRVGVAAYALWQAWGRDLAARSGFGVVDLGEPAPLARVRRDGGRS
jgi:hypothetical protein